MTAIIAGAGPAGLTAAYELLQDTGVRPEVHEASADIGGISRTVGHHGNRMDIGGHRFFSHDQRIIDWWCRMLPVQGAPSKDDLLLGLDGKQLSLTGPDPEREDGVMLVRRRVSRILFDHRFFDYPITISGPLLRNLGAGRLCRAAWGYLWAKLRPLPPTSLENFYVNRFGRPLYEMFFKTYTSKVWGIHPSHLSADWGSQRVRGLSVTAVLRDMLRKAFGAKRNDDEVETSLIEQFFYPKYGPGQLWETVAEKVRLGGGVLSTGSSVTRIHVEGRRVRSVTVTQADGTAERRPCDYFLSSMPIPELIAALDGIEVPDEVRRIAAGLPFRDFITVGLCVNRLKISNQTRLKTFRQRVPDTWIYIQEPGVRLGRLQIFNNWSPYLVSDYEHTVWLGLEYFCSEGDELWQMSREDFIAMATDELVQIGLLEPGAVLDACMQKVRKAYPAYYGTYQQLGVVRAFLDQIENLFCIGRNGQHRYNNMDHSMLTAMEAVGCIRSGNLSDKRAVWNVNA
ncbi:MAG: NAD(P)/FAD-dependent oxidoreductase [Bacteroidales bacterium]|nr:NAD(P)/FAD-dependent oxidoreductase [Bacteroidales bacterium]